MGKGGISFFFPWRPEGYAWFSKNLRENVKERKLRKKLKNKFKVNKSIFNQQTEVSIFGDFNLGPSPTSLSTYQTIVW